MSTGPKAKRDENIGGKVMEEGALKVLVVDDMVVHRRMLQSVVAEIPYAQFVGTAANGRIALEKLSQLDVDIVLLDVEMPEMDGLETLQEIHQRWPGMGVVLLSGDTRAAVDLTVRALELGALDFVTKAETGDAQRDQRVLVTHLTGVMRAFQVARHLRGVDVAAGSRSLSPIAVAGSFERRTRAAGEGEGQTAAAVGPPGVDVERQANSGSPGPLRGGFDVLLIGSSTGGPQALARLIPALPGDLGVPVLVVQHMPPVFTASLAENLNRCSKLAVVEACDNQLVLPNTVFVAPGGKHMVVKGELGKGDKRLFLNEDPPVNSVRPAVDVLFQSAARCYGGRTLSVVLTGMGEDGLEGVKALRRCGGRTLTQSAASCVVYGMPRAIERAGFSDAVLSLDDLAGRIALLARQTFSARTRLGQSG